MYNDRIRNMCNILILVTYFLCAWNIILSGDRDSISGSSPGNMVCAAEQSDVLSSSTRYYAEKDYSHLFDLFGGDNEHLRSRIESYQLHVGKANMLIREMNMLVESGMSDSPEYRDILVRFDNVVKTVHLQEEGFRILSSR